MCSKNSLDTFADILINSKFVILTNSDFPTPIDPYQ